MLANAEVMCFLATADADRAMTFYRDVLGLTLIEDGPFGLAFSVGGRMLRIQKLEQFTPAYHTSLGWRVDGIRRLVRALAERGVRFERYEALQQDDLGIWTAPSGAQVAWFRDLDGNTLSLTQWRVG